MRKSLTLVTHLTRAINRPTNLNLLLTNVFFRALKGLYWEQVSCDKFVFNKFNIEMLSDLTIQKILGVGKLAFLLKR